jgi:hypothetical protein
MGRMKDFWIELQESSFEIQVAKILGITLDDLMRLDWDIETEQSVDGLTYGHRIEFSHNSPKSILSKIKNLEDGYCVYLEPGQLEQDYDDEELFETIIHDSTYVRRFKDEIVNLEKLLWLKVHDEQLEEILYRQIFIGVISRMETFLSEVFINLTCNSNKYLRNFVKTHPYFSNSKFDLCNIFDEYENIENTARKVMIDTIYHKLPNVAHMFQGTFEIEFPSIKEVFPYVVMRHDLVHRNGKTKDNKNVNTDFKTVCNLIETVNQFVSEIIEKLKL